MDEAFQLGLKLQSASVDPRSEPSTLLGRSAACEAIKQVAINNCTQRCSSDHGVFSFLIAAGHVRSGKTRMGTETPRLIEQACQQNENLSALSILKPVYLKMDFLNGCRFDKSFDTRGISASVALGARLMYAFHGTPPDMEDTGYSLKRITHDQAFYYIISRMLRDKGSESIVPLVCHFDEHGDFTNQIDNSAENEDESAGRDHFIEMLRLIGSTATASDSRLRELHGRFFIVPIATGTSKKEANIGGVSKYGVKQLPLPALSFENSIQLAQEFFSISAEKACSTRIENELKKLSFRIGLADTGGLPGLVGMLCAGGLVSTGAYSEHLHDKVVQYTGGVDWSTRWPALVSVCLARPLVKETTVVVSDSKVTANGKTITDTYTISDARDSGTILFDNNEIGVSASLLRRLNTDKNNQFFNPLLLKHISNDVDWTWQDFKKAHALYLGAVMAALIKTEKDFFKKVTLMNLLRHAQPTKNAHLARTLVLPSSFDGINLSKVEKQSIPKANTGKRKRHHGVDLDLKDAVLLAADGTPIIDAHLNLTLSNAVDDARNDAVALFIQYKHKKLNSKTKVKVSEMNAAVKLLELRLNVSKWEGGEWLFLWVSNREVEMDMTDPDQRLLWVGKDDLVKHAPLIGRRGLVTKEIIRADEVDE